MKRLLLCLQLCFLLLVIGCAGREEIKLGFLGILSGRMGDLGVSGRDGAIIAVNDINNRGGINGRNILLVVEDNEFDPDICRAKAEELVAADIEGLIGPMTSDMTLACIDIFNNAKIPMVSPTASTPKLSDIDDYFLRVNPSDESEGIELARYTSKNIEGDTIAVIYDTVNETFSRGVYEKYVQALRQLKEVEINAYTFTSDQNPQLSTLVSEVLDDSPDGIFIIASAVDTGTLCQQIRILGSDAVIMATGWAMSDEFVKQGGAAADGVIFNHYHNNNSTAPAYRKFVDSFTARFNRSPDFIAALSYNAVSVWAEAYEAKTKSRDVKSKIIDIGTFMGLQGEIVINQYGDAFLERHFITIRDGEFIDI